MAVRLAESREELEACFPVVRQLRPQLSLELFLERVASQRAAGYRIAFALHEGRPAAVAGYRVQESLHAGRFLYVDDLVTDEALRSHGFGAELLRWLRDEARARSCESLQLDSGVQRKDAHRFYEREGLRITSYHFAQPLR